MAKAQEFRIEGFDELNRRLEAAVSEREVLRVAQNAFRRTARHIRKEIVDNSRKRGILRRLYGRKRKDLNRSLKLSRVRRHRDDYEAPLSSTSGLMAIQELGGRFKPHEIRPKNAPKLVFVTHGRLVVTSKVNHPGATHPKMPVFWPAVQESGPRLRAETAQAIADHLRSSLRG